MSNKINEILSKVHSPDQRYFKANYLHNKIAYLNKSTRDNLWIEKIFYKTYINLLNPIFLRQINTLSLLDNIEYIYARDGIYGLIYFFCNFPEPPHDFRTTIVVPKEFSIFIPSSWDKHLIYYEYVLNERSQILYDSAYICGICSEFNSSEEKIKGIVDNINQHDYQSCYTHLSLIDDFRTQDLDKIKPNPTLLKSFYKYTSKELNFLTEEELLSLSAPGFIYNINDSSEMIYDDFIDHYLISNGSIPFETISISKSTSNFYLKLSEYHRLYLVAEHGNSENLWSEISYMQNFLCPKGDFFNSDMIYFLKELSDTKVNVNKWKQLRL